MMTSISDLVEQFSQLDGATVGARTRSLNRYLDRLRAAAPLASPEGCDSFVAALQPKNRLEQIFRVRVLRHLERKDDLVRVLLSEDVRLIKPLLRSKWFLRVLLEPMSPDVLVQDMLVHVSYVLRRRLLALIAKHVTNETLVNLHYAKIKETYGQKHALVLISACSLDLVLTEVKAFNLHLSDEMLLSICTRTLCADFLEEYFRVQHQNRVSLSEYSKTWRHLALRNAPLFWQLTHKYDVRGVKLSARATLNIMQHYKGEVLRNFGDTIYQFHVDAFLSQLNHEQFRQFYCAILPDSADDYTKAFSPSNFSITHAKYLKRYPRSVRLLLIESTFLRKYGAELRENVACITEPILEMYEAADREDIVLQKLNAGEPDYWLQYHPLNRSLPIIKFKVNLSSGAHRTTYANYLIGTCKYNRDPGALLNALNFFCNRLLDDTPNTKYEFLKQLYAHFDMAKLSALHWGLVMKIVSSLFVSESLSWQWLVLLDISRKQLEHHVLHKLPLTTPLVSFLKLKVFYDKLEPEVVVSRDILDALLDQFDALSDAAHLNKVEFFAFICGSIIAWNSAQPAPDRCIPLWSITLAHEFLRHIMKSKYQEFYQYLVHFVKEPLPVTIAVAADAPSTVLTAAEDNLVVLQQELFNFVWTTSFFRHCNYECSWFMRHQPEFVFRYADKIVENSFCNKADFSALAYEALKYSHLDLPNKLRAKALSIVNNPENITSNPLVFEKAVYILSYQNQATENSLVASDIMRLIFDDGGGGGNSDTNADGVGDVNNHSGGDANGTAASAASANGAASTLAVVMIRSLTNNPIPSSTHATLMKLMRSRYGPIAVNPLYCIVQHTPEQRAKAFIAELCASTAARVRKHGLVLTISCLSENDVYERLRIAGETETAPAVQRVILVQMLKCYIAYGTQSFGELLKEHMLRLDDDDYEAHEQLLAISLIPIANRFEFIDFVWNLYDRNDNKTIKDLKFRMLRDIDGRIFGRLTDRFSDKLLSSFVDPALPAITHDMQAFVCHCLLFGNFNKIVVRATIILSFLRSRPRQLFEFVTNLCAYFIYKMEENSGGSGGAASQVHRVFAAFHRTWLDMFDMTHFGQYVMLHCTEIYFTQLLLQQQHPQQGTFNTAQFAKNFLFLCENLLEALGATVVSMLAQCFQQFARIIFDTRRMNYYEEYYSVLNYIAQREHLADEMYIFVIDSLHTKHYNTSRSKQLVSEIMNKLFSINSYQVKAHLNNYLSKL